MKYLIICDIEGVTGVTTFEQAEQSEYAKKMLMSDLNAVIKGIRSYGNNEIVIFDLHTDGRNVALAELEPDVSVIVGKPINRNLYKAAGNDFDGIFLVGFHAMASRTESLLAHTYLRDYTHVRINNLEMGEIGVEAALAGEQGIPLLFFSGDSDGCEEARELVPGIVTAEVKKSLGATQGLCSPPEHTAAILCEAAAQAVSRTKSIRPFKLTSPFEITITINEGEYRSNLKRYHSELFNSSGDVCLRGEKLLESWNDYLQIEREMVNL